MNLRTKLVVLFVVTICLPLIIIGYFIMTAYGSKVVEQTSNITQENALQTASNIKGVLQQYVDIVNRISYDQQLNHYLAPSRVYKNDLESIDAHSLYLKPVLYYDNYYREPDAQIKVYFHNETLLQDGQFYVRVDYEAMNSPEYRTARAAEGKLVWGVTMGKIYIARAMYSLLGELSAVVALHIPESRLFSLIADGEQSGINDKVVLITDSRGNVITSSRREQVGDSLLGEPYFMTSGESYPFKYKDAVTSLPFIALEERLAHDMNFTDWRLLTLIPLDRIQKEERQIRQIGLMVAIVGLAVSCFLFIIVLNKITARIKRLVGKMQDVERGGELTILEELGSADEIGVLTRSFNDLVVSLQQSIFHNYETHLLLKDITIRKQEAELYALQNQINPHFLFNTLESIRMGLHSNGDTVTSTVVLNLSKMFRNTLYWHGEFIQLKEELNLISNYLAIQKYRFQERIQYEINLPEDLGSAFIPKLTIQPIVENAVKHGIECLFENGIIVIDIRETEFQVMEISVQDNGPGMDEESLCAIRAKLQELDLNKSEGIGLKNVHDRLMLHYGSGYGLTIGSGSAGTCVTIRLPVHYERQKNRKEDDNV